MPPPVVAAPVSGLGKKVALAVMLAAAIAALGAWWFGLLSPFD